MTTSELPADLASFLEGMMLMLDAFYAGKSGGASATFDDMDMLRRVQAAMVHVHKYRDIHMSGRWSHLTDVVSDLVSVTGEPSISQLKLLRDRRRRVRLEAAEAAAKNTSRHVAFERDFM